MKQKTLIKFVVFIILIVVALLIINYFDLQSRLNTQAIREMVDSSGIFGPLTFILLYILTSVLFLPGAIFSIASGAIFGRVLGTVYTVIGATLGATLAFLISRYFARSLFVETLVKKYKKIKEYDHKLERNGFVTVLFLRLVPLFPFNGLNFGLGITKVKLKDYFIATLIGIIPGSFLYAYLGESLVEMNLVNILVAIVLIILLSLSLNVYKAYKKRRIDWWN